MEESGTTRVSLKEESGFTLELERSLDFHMKPYSQQPTSSSSLHEVKVTAKQQEETRQKESNQEFQSSKEVGYDIKSPMVGTFYSSPSPDEPTFVNIGDIVTEDTIVCIIEAMKVMNEVKAGKSGKIVDIYIENAHPVEFGTKLFKIEV